jgi:hypothetical protein
MCAVAQAVVLAVLVASVIASDGHSLLQRASGGGQTSLDSEGSGMAFAHPGVHHLAGVGAGGEDRVVAEHLRVAEPGLHLERLGASSCRAGYTRLPASNGR